MISVLLFCILFLFMLPYQFYCQADNTYYQHDTQKNHRRSHIYFLFLYNANPHNNVMTATIAPIK